MATLNDTRDTVINIINEVRRKLGLPAAASIVSDDHSRVLLDYLNDVITYISDWGDWVETIREVEVTASVSVRDYVVETSAVVKNIKEICFGSEKNPMRLVNFEDMRRHVRASSTGSPLYWTIIGINPTWGNPVFRVSPQVDSNANNKTFKIVFHERPRRLTTSDGSYLIPFDARIVTQMLLALALLDESRGTQNMDFRTEMARFDDMIRECYNRYNGDSGEAVQFRPFGR